MSFSRQELFRCQQLLVEAFPDEYDVVVHEGYLALTTVSEPKKTKLFKSVEAVDQLLSSSQPSVKLLAWELELERIKGKIFPLFKFKREICAITGVKSTCYQRPGAELKIWLFPSVTMRMGAPLPPNEVKVGYGKITDMYSRNAKTFNTADELLALLTSGEYR